MWGRREGDAALRHGCREQVRLEEVEVDGRALVLKVYLKRAPNARAHLPVHKDALLAEFEQVAHRFPVFRVMPAPYYLSTSRSRARLALNSDSHAASPASSEEDDVVREPVQ